MLSRLIHSPTGLVGLAIVLIVIIVSIFAPFLAPHNPLKPHFKDSLAPPLSPGYVLGTDALGRDLLSRVIYAGRISLLVGFISVGISLFFGIAAGLISGYFGGWIDALLMRVVELQLSFPFILLAIVVNSILGTGLRNIIVTLVLIGWVTIARVVRGEVLGVRNKTYVEAAIATGVSAPGVILRHILPNIITPIIVVGALQTARFIVAEAAVSFLGFGVQPPTPAWGNMLSEGRDYMFTAWWLATFPGLALVVTILGVNLLGDWLRDSLTKAE